MDDFSWGSTRLVEGERKGEGHGDKEGEFDSHAITMKRWSEWERERRWKSASQLRDSAYDVVKHNGSTQYGSTNRNSIVSTDTFVSQGNLQDPFNRTSAASSPFSAVSPAMGRRADSVQVLEMPVPLSVVPQQQLYQHIPSSTEVYDAVDPNSLHNYEASPYPSSSSENIHQPSSSHSRPEDD